jgi:hypothetical protein
MAETRAHYSEDVVERYSMGRLGETELATFEEHLLLCEACQEAVRKMDSFVNGIKTAIQATQEHEGHSRETPISARRKGQYLVLQATLPNREIENIGILLLDTDSDRLHCRFRRDLKEFAGSEGDWFEHLADDLSKKAAEFGGQKCLRWMESTFSNAVRISTRQGVLIENCATTIDSLYAQHIRPTVLRFRTHLPLYTLEAAAGRFDTQMTAEPEGWIEIHADISLREDMFVAHVKGHSMEPMIPDASLCAFRSTTEGSWNGKVLLIEHPGTSRKKSYTVNRVHFIETVNSNQDGENIGLHQTVTLESLNPQYHSWKVPSTESIRVLGEFLFVVGPDQKRLQRPTKQNTS